MTSWPRRTPRRASLCRTGGSDVAKLPSLKGIFARARTTAEAPVAEVEVDVQAARGELRDAEAAVIAADAAYSAALLTADDAGLKKLDDDRRDAARRLDRAKALIAALDERLAAAQEAERRAELSRIIEAAVAAQGEFREAVERDLPMMAEMARTILALRTDAERATAAANRAIAEAGEGEPLPGVEAFRALPGRPYEELSCEVRDLWVDDAGNVSGYQDQITAMSDGSGALRLPGATYLRRFSMKRPVKVVEYLPAEPGVVPPSLDVALLVPDAFPIIPQAQDRRPVTEMMPHGPAREVAKTAPSRLDRMAMGHGS